jgi:hypothetical protein
MTFRYTRFLLCAALASSLACGEDLEAAPDAGPAQADANVGEDESLLHIGLGTVASDSDIEVEIPDNAIGFHVIVQSSAGGAVGIRSITGPNGELLATDYVPDQAPAPMLQVPDGIATATIPQSSHPAAIPVSAGTWTLQFSGAGTLTASVFVRLAADGEFHGGTLDLTVYIPEGLTISDPDPEHVVSAASAATDNAVAARIDSFFATLEELFGIGRGAVRFVGIDAEFRSIAYDQLGAVLENTSGNGPTGAHVVFLNELTFQGSPLWGTSSGLPGTATSTGHSRSGVALDISLGFGAIADGKTMVHELGHFAGLFHTTDPSGVYPDTLSDTPTCVNTANVLSCPDRNNIMFFAFWGASGGVDIQTSEHQRRIMHASPLYRASESASATRALARSPLNAFAAEVPSQVEMQLFAGLCGAELQRGNAPQFSSDSADELRSIAGDAAKPKILRQRARAALSTLSMGR